ncbi:MAG: GNAT family N-acetyltransferase [Nitrospirae bacterium]|nr:GNAT family N-acetyltransferase [Nitrospirota bacterium]
MAWTPRRLETPRLILQPTGEDDDRAGLDTWLQQRVGLPNQWRIISKALDRVIGIVGFIRWEPERGCAEIGFGLVKVASGQGLMTEACRAVIDYGFAEMDLSRIEARCQLANLASARVLEKIGMTREGMVRGRVHSKVPDEDFWLYAIERGVTGNDASSGC